jgi:hypothetical protein
MKHLLLLTGFALLAGCADPLAGIPRFDPAEVQEGSRSLMAPGDSSTGPEADGDKTTAEAEKDKKPGGILGIFGADDRPETGAAAPESALPEVTYDETVPYGTVARACAARGRPLGRKVATAEARGYRLYDSAPRSEGLRTFYITGFPDGCPRQITAVNALFGTPSMYESLHYGPAGAHLGKGKTDAAYESLKRRVCGSGKGRPCGSAMGEMDRTTFFLTYYPRMGATPRWAELLIHRGEVLASDFKSPG